MKSGTGRQRRIVVLLSSLMICGALLAACQNGSGAKENQNANGPSSTEQGADGTTVHLTDESGSNGKGSAEGDSTTNPGSDEGAGSGSDSVPAGEQVAMEMVVQEQKVHLWRNAALVPSKRPLILSLW